ncbi:cytochrome c [Rubrivivax albus]|uniref:Cytochrome c n=1 Tax=Rubrivivax albus TaxID=2499835 RepID=A0A3S2TP19_9BURK|nr:cytochrome c [Rubrivivax albus]
MIGLYPTWFEPGVGSGWIVGIIATIHVLASHTSVGAAVFFAGLAVYAHRVDKPEYLDFIRRYGLFLLVFSYVIGSITGPGIWYSTTVASPRGISALIHSFVWKWATEWVFFVIEVVGVYMLVYLAGKVDRRTHLNIALVFGLAGYTTMLIIIGILSFMMWPGQPEWFTDGGYLNGFYGANTWAQLALRTAFMLTMTAVVGGIVASRFEDADVKRRVLRVLAWVGIVSTVAGALLQRWYLATLPESALVVLENRMPAGYAPAMATVLALTLAWFVWTLVQPRRVHMAMASVMTVALLVLGLWPGETTRESIRKPFVAGQYVYSNQVIARDVPGMGIRSELPALEAHGFLKLHPFAPDALRQVDGSNLLEAGRFLALTTCSNCHSLTNTGMRPLARYFGGNTDVPALAAYLQAALSTGNTMYMPTIPLRDDEAEALATYIASLSDPAAAQAWVDRRTRQAAVLPSVADDAEGAPR